MRRTFAVLAILLLAGFATSSGQPVIFQPLPTVVQPRLAYSVDPPRQITVEIPSTTLYVDLRSQGRLQLNGSLPQAGNPHGYSAVIVNICTQWEIYGTYPGATMYQIRPKMDLSMAWQNYALHFDVPGLYWGTPLGLNASIIPSTYFRSYPPTTQKYAIQPAPALELGPSGMKGSVSQPYQLDVTFPTLSLEWFRWSGTARFRAGNVVLHGDAGWWWDPSNDNAIYLGNFHIDLATGAVSFINWRAGNLKVPTLLTVTIDEGPDMILFEPDLWW